MFLTIPSNQFRTRCHKSEEALSFFNVNKMNHLKIAEVSILFYVQNHMGHGEHSNLLYSSAVKYNGYKIQTT